MHLGVFRRSLVTAVVGSLAALGMGQAAAAPRTVTCLKTVTIRYDDAAMQQVGDLGPADGPCELALHATPDTGTAIRFITLRGTPKEFAKIKKMKGEERIALLANQVAGGAGASPPQDIEQAGPYTVGFTMMRSPSNATSYVHIASALYEKALLYVVLEQRVPPVDPAPRYDKDAARRTLLTFLAGVQLGAPAKK